MAALSTLKTLETMNATCTNIIHPCTQSCVGFGLWALWKSFFSAVPIFALLYLPTALPRLHKNPQKALHSLVIAVMRTSAYAGANCGISMILTCCLREYLGRFTILVPGIVGSSTIFLESPCKRKLLSFLVGNSRQMGRRVSPAQLTALFMLSSSVLLYLLRQPQFRQLTNPGEAFWFYYPPVVRPESQDTIKNPKKSSKRKLETVRLLAAGVALQVGRVCIRNLRRPSVLLRKLLTFDTYRLGLFLSGYVALYKVAAWVLTQLRGKDDALNAIPAGLLAGCTLHLCPQPIFALSAFTYTVQLLLKAAHDRVGRPYSYACNSLFVSIIGSYLAHNFYEDPLTSPPWFTNLLTTTSGGIYGDIRIRAFKCIHTYNFPVALGGIDFS